MEQHLYTVKGYGISPDGREVKLVTNNVPATSQQEAARKAVEHWTANGAKDAQAHAAAVTSGEWK